MEATKKKCWKKCGREARPGQADCRECHAEYERSNRVKRTQARVAAAYLAGFAGLKAQLTQTFARIGRGEMTGYTALEVVRNSKPDVSRGAPHGIGHSATSGSELR